MCVYDFRLFTLPASDAQFVSWAAMVAASKLCDFLWYGDDELLSVVFIWLAAPKLWFVILRGRERKISGFNKLLNTRRKLNKNWFWTDWLPFCQNGHYPNIYILNCSKLNRNTHSHTTETYCCNAARSLCGRIRCDPNISALFSTPLVPAPLKLKLISTGRLCSNWLGHEPERTCCGCDKWIVFRLAAAVAAVAPVTAADEFVCCCCCWVFVAASVPPIVLSSKTGLSIEYVGADCWTGDFDRLIFVMRLIKFTVDDDWDPIV